MTKELIQEFSQFHAEPEWLASLRQKAFDKIDQLDLPVIERVKFHRWNLGDGRISDSQISHLLGTISSLSKWGLRQSLSNCQLTWQSKGLFLQIFTLP